MAKAKASSKKAEKTNVEEPQIVTTTSAMDQPLEDSVETLTRKKLSALFTLQLIDAKIDKIRNIRGELPLEVQDLEDEIEGLETRISKYNQEITELEMDITSKTNAIKDSHELLKKYEAQQMNVRNNREYDSLSKEIEYQNLEIQLSEKKIKEFAASIEAKKEFLDKAETELEERKNDLDVKNNELKDIVEETQKEEEILNGKSDEQSVKIDDRLLKAYKRIRSNAKNGLAVVPIERDACGGCFNKISPQRQLDIKLHKKVIVCEYCGRILIDDKIIESVSI